MDDLEIQRSLNKHGYNLKEDGFIGPVTKSAIIHFQVNNKLKPDGRVGPKTMAALGVFDTPFMQAKREVWSPADDAVKGLYSALNEAETGNEGNQWIRTKYAPPEGSTAFGPVQITGSLVETAVANKVLSPESTKFYNDVLAPMYKNFREYGREPKKPGYDPAYDYGGSGYFSGPENREKYERLAQELLAHELKRAKGDKLKAAEAWRGRTDNQDTRFFYIIKKHINK